jgi:hypothetical protein
MRKVSGVAAVSLWAACVLGFSAYAATNEVKTPQTDTNAVNGAKGTSNSKNSPTGRDSSQKVGSQGQTNQPGQQVSAKSAAGEIKGRKGGGEGAKDRQGQVVSQEAELKRLDQLFKKARQDWDAQNANLKQELRQAGTDEARSVIKQQINAARDAWMAEQNALREEIRDRIRELRTEFRNQELNRVIDSSGGGSGRKGRP